MRHIARVLLAALLFGACDSPAPTAAPTASATARPAPSAATAKSTAAATPAPSASVATAPSSSATAEPLDPKAVWNGKWPLPQMMSANRCKTASGEPGLTVNGRECHNPCLPGAAPLDAMQCTAKCTSDADCTKDGRHGSCDDGACRRPKTLECEGKKAPTPCKTEDGETGQRCDADQICASDGMICPEGLVMYGGTNCVKTCKKAADCPKGECAMDEGMEKGVGICAPICPSEGCPYLWE
jgi:hypothetical protein